MDEQQPRERSRSRRPWLALLALAFVVGLLAGRLIVPSGGAVGTEPSSPVAAVSPTPSSSPRDATAVPGGSPSTGGSATPGGRSVSPRPATSLPPGAPENFGLFFEALQVAQDNFVDESALDPTNLTYGAIRGMIEALGDTGHTVFLTPQDVRSANAALDGRVTGIGAFLGERESGPFIQSVIRGGPADRAGIRSGDAILAVDGVRVADLGAAEVASRIRGEAGTTVRIEILHRGASDSETLEIVREEVTVPAVLWGRIPGTDSALVQLNQFSSGAGEQFRDALQAALSGGARSIVFDLRGNGGGFTEEAVVVASQLLRSGNVYLLADRAGKRTEVPVRPGGVATEVPVVVLVDAGTASSAEIVSGALQDAGRARIVGSPTAGTGTVLNTFPLSDGSAVRIGVQQWLTPSGERIFGRGITPDERVALEPGAELVGAGDLESLTPEALRTSGDAQLLRALELLGEGG